MRTIGFSTGALARADFRRALRMVERKGLSAVELSALRYDELEPLVEQIETLDLSSFEYISFHAPSAIEREFEDRALHLLERVAERGWPIIVHPDAIWTPQKWSRLGNRLCLENMDKRKPLGQTADDLVKFFEILPDSSLCFDIGHARQVDPTMSEAASILTVFADRIQQLHVSEVNSQSKHDRLSFESVLAFQRVSHLLPADVPVILESRVEEAEIEEEVKRASNALIPENQLAIAGD
jgi:sugar phosphate isomerase/epimerase